jgi:hypothetical protein
MTGYMDRKPSAMARYASQLPAVFARVGNWEAATRRYAQSLVGETGRFHERVWRPRS